MTRLRRNARIWAGILVVAVGFGAALSRPASAAPYAEIVIDARSGQVIREQNADSRLHPASLTKMMTLYVAFDAINRGEIGLDDYVTVSSHAAGEAPSKLYLKPGQKIQVRYLIRGAAINNEMKKQVLAGLDTSALTGKTISVTGAFTLVNPKNWLVTPVESSVQ